MGKTKTPFNYNVLTIIIIQFNYLLFICNNIIQKQQKK
jgi:hypothetical protein